MTETVELSKTTSQSVDRAMIERLATLVTAAPGSSIQGSFSPFDGTLVGSCTSTTTNTNLPVQNTLNLPSELSRLLGPVFGDIPRVPTPRSVEMSACEGRDWRAGVGPATLPCDQ